MIEEELKKLNQKYLLEQKRIVSERKNGSFLTKEKDVEEQERVWIEYLMEKHRITRREEDLENIVNHFFKKVASQYLYFRDLYLEKKITKSIYLERRNGIFVDFEKKLIDLGLTRDVMIQKHRDIFLNRAREIEDDFLARFKFEDIEQRTKLCSKQSIILNDYFDLLKSL